MIKSISELTLKQREFLFNIHCSIPKKWDPHFVINPKQLEFAKNIFLESPTNYKISFKNSDQSNSEIIAFVVFSIEATEGHILSSWCSSSHRNNGLIKGLKKELHKYAQDHQLARIKTRCHTSNAVIIQLNQKLGYKIIGENNSFVEMQLEFLSETLT